MHKFFVLDLYRSLSKFLFACLALRTSLHLKLPNLKCIFETHF